jgi:lipoprotein-releasing system permease protein
LIGCGLFWGNLIGIGILLLQKQFEFIKLDTSVYHVTVAPVFLDWTYVVLLNLMAFILCVLMLLIPSFLISKIVPVKAIEFE